MSGRVYVLGVSMSVQRQDNDQSCICVRCIDVCTNTIDTHIHHRSLACLCTDTSMKENMATMSSHVYVLGVSMVPLFTNLLLDLGNVLFLKVEVKAHTRSIAIPNTYT
jgi:polyferredoxin